MDQNSNNPFFKIFTFESNDMSSSPQGYLHPLLDTIDQTPSVITTASKNIIVYFKSNDVIGARGFQLSFEQSMKFK